MTDMDRVAEFLGSAPKVKKVKPEAEVLQAWRAYVKDLEAFVKGLKKGSIPPDAAEPAVPAETGDSAGVKKLVTQAGNERRKIPDARAIAAELQKARAARDARAAYAAGATPDAGPSTYSAWSEPVIGPENADDAYSLEAMERQDREAAAALLYSDARVPQPSRVTSQASTKPGFFQKVDPASGEVVTDWIKVGGGGAVLLGLGYLAMRALRRRRANPRRRRRARGR